MILLGSGSILLYNLCHQYQHSFLYLNPFLVNERNISLMKSLPIIYFLPLGYIKKSQATKIIFLIKKIFQKNKKKKLIF